MHTLCLPKHEMARTSARFTTNGLWVSHYPREDDTCPICTRTFSPEDIETGNIVYVVQCGHVMHTDEYLRMRAQSCPICRADLTFSGARLLPRELFRSYLYNDAYKALSQEDREEMQQAWESHQGAMLPYHGAEALQNLHFRRNMLQHYTGPAFPKYTTYRRIKLPHPGPTATNFDNVLLLLHNHQLLSYRVQWTGIQGHCSELPIASWSPPNEARNDLQFSIAQKGSVAAYSYSILGDTEPPQLLAKIHVFDPQKRSRPLIAQCDGVTFEGQPPLFNASGTHVALCVRVTLSLHHIHIYHTSNLQIVLSKSVNAPYHCLQTLHWVGNTQVRWLARIDNTLTLVSCNLMDDDPIIVHVIPFEHVGPIEKVEMAETAKGTCANLTLSDNRAFMLTLDPLCMVDFTERGEDLWNKPHPESSCLQGPYVVCRTRSGELDFKQVRPRFLL